MNIQESFQLLVNYFSYRQRNRHLFIHLNAQDESIQQALKDGFPGVLQQRDRSVMCVQLCYSSVESMLLSCFGLMLLCEFQERALCSCYIYCPLGSLQLFIDRSL